MILARNDLCAGPIVVDETSICHVGNQAQLRPWEPTIREPRFMDFAYCYGEPNDSLARQTDRGHSN